MKSNADAVLSAKSLHYFLQLIDSMSYTQASQILGITQPALTQQIKKLERAVGSPLFGQVGKKLYLTDAGIKMEETARSLFATVHGAVDVIQQYTDSDSGEIHIGALTTIEAHVLDDFLISFKKKYPDIKITFSFYDRQELWDKLDKNELDFAILYVPDHHATVNTMKQYVSKKIYDEGIVLLSPAKGKKLNEIAEGKWVSYPKDSYLPQVLERYYSANFPENGLDVTARFSATYQLVQFAQALNCNTFVTKSFYEAHKNKISLNEVVADPIVDFQSCFIYRKSKAEIPRLKNFLKEWDLFLKEKDYTSRLDESNTLI